MRIDRLLVGPVVALAVVAGPRLAAADDGPPAVSMGQPVAPAKQMIWVDPPPAPRNSSVAIGFGIGLMVAGAVQIPLGAMIFANSHPVICDFGGGGGGPGSCGSVGSGKRNGGIMIGSGVAALAAGIPLTVWGASRGSTSDISVGLGSVSSTFRF